MLQVVLDQTFIANLFLAKICKDNHIALAVAYLGIVITLLDGGWTAHSVFMLPLNLAQTDNATCNISKVTIKAPLLRECHLILWDECTKSHKGAFVALDSMLKDLLSNDTILG